MVYCKQEWNIKCHSAKAYNHYFSLSFLHITPHHTIFKISFPSLSYSSFFYCDETCVRISCLQRGWKWAVNVHNCQLGRFRIFALPILLSLDKVQWQLTFDHFDGIHSYEHIGVRQNCFELGLLDIGQAFFNGQVTSRNFIPLSPQGALHWN